MKLQCSTDGGSQLLVWSGGSKSWGLEKSGSHYIHKGTGTNSWNSRVGEWKDQTIANSNLNKRLPKFMSYGHTHTFTSINKCKILVHNNVVSNVNNYHVRYWEPAQLQQCTVSSYQCKCLIQYYYYVIFVLIHVYILLKLVSWSHNLPNRWLHLPDTEGK